MDIFTKGKISKGSIFKRKSDSDKNAVTPAPIIDIVQKFLESYSVLKNSEPKQILEQMLADGILDAKRMRNYLIVMEYYKHLGNHGGHSIKTINFLGERYGMSPRQIQNVLYKWTGKFKKS